MPGSILIMTKSLILLGRYDLNTAESCSLEHLFNETSCYPTLGLCVPICIICSENSLFMSSIFYTPSILFCLNSILSTIFLNFRWVMELCKICHIFYFLSDLSSTLCHLIISHCQDLAFSLQSLYFTKIISKLNREFQEHCYLQLLTCEIHFCPCG